MLKIDKNTMLALVSFEIVPLLRSFVAKIDADTCISCGACAAECPVSAISEGDSAYVIDADTCIECGACASACPVGAPAAE